MFRSRYAFLHFSFMAWLLCVPSHAQQTTSRLPTENVTLTVTITGLRNAKGLLHVFVFNGEKGGKGFPLSQKDAFKVQDISLASALASSGEKTTVVFRDLPPGIYAVALYHDENSNNKLDSYWYGKPREGISASNNPRPKMRAPRFKEAEFDLKADKNVELHLWYP